MKYLVLKILLPLMIGIFLYGCSDKETVNIDALLESPESRVEIMRAICNDHELMTDMMDQIMLNNHAIQMIKQNEAFQNKLNE